ncbi:MAG: polyribonucleotide nucleotidyltransferase [Alphaproteobacteria bacterium]|nr:polyribonucleotide nucleotidyltransferase [Alphaproteobacteria bacterium]
MQMFDIHQTECQWGERKLSMQSGLVARQADGAVVITYDETTLLCTAVAAREAKPGQDFFPLTVNYQEKTFAAGKIPGGFFKREGRPSEKETLTSRLIDRPIRPLFPKSFKNETQVICTVLEHDLENDPDIVALVGASAALTISGIPFMGPIGAARVGMVNGEFLLNPVASDMTHSTLNLVVAGTNQGVLMVESEANELSEEQMLAAVEFGHAGCKEVIGRIIQLANECAKEPWDLPEPEPIVAEIATKAKKDLSKKIIAAYDITSKQERVQALDALKSDWVANFEEQDIPSNLISAAFKQVEEDEVRGNILKTRVRIDGRGTTDIRPIDARVGILPRTHGSALFTRGETQALVVTTLGTTQDEQIVDALEGSYRENFMLHYNFPPYSVGEASFLKSPGRREIGHGKLAWRALRALLPLAEDFPYTIRLVSEVTESNGSSSMATVCGSSMAMMDAAVPLKAPCAGFAMGLIKSGEDYVVLSDILGDEDHLGDMDFKVAGTAQGITALQMDIKITSITPEIMKIALEQARNGRLHILGEMAKGIGDTRAEVSNFAPRITSIQIAKEKIREVIGTGGKVIREISETTGAKIDIDDEGKVKIAAVSAEAGEQALRWIEGIVAEAEPGKIYRGKVVRVMNFGAFVNFLGAKDGLVHISELVNRRVNQVSDIVNEGDEVWVKCIHIDDRGKVKLSMKVVDQDSGAELSAE